MFNEKDGMRMEPTPERVLAVCRTVGREKSAVSIDKLRRILSLGAQILPDEIDDSIAVARELNAVVIENGKAKLAVPAETFSSYISFRRYAAGTVFLRQNSTFFRFTSWFIGKNDQIFQCNDWEAMSEMYRNEHADGAEKLSENGVLGWRFWSAFLGIGYLVGTTMIPNMKIRLQDIFACEFPKVFRYGEPVRSEAFLNWLNSCLPEVRIFQRNRSVLPLALSAALRTLDELQLIKLESLADSVPTRLFYVAGEPIQSFSQVTVCEEVCA